MGCAGSQDWISDTKCELYVMEQYHEYKMIGDLFVVEQPHEIQSLSKELGRFTCVSWYKFIAKLPPSWRNFNTPLKLKGKSFSLSI